MHPYSTDESRVATYGVLAVVAVLAAWAIGLGTKPLRWPEWVVSAPSIAATFAASYALFNTKLWRTAAARRLGLSRLPDLSGIYRGRLTSTYLDGADQHVERDIEIRIKQSWTKLVVEMDVLVGTSSSRSQSAVAHLGDGGTATRLVYVYRNRVSPAVADADMSDHDGAAEVDIRPDGHLMGRYFNARPRAGTIIATRVTV